MDINKEENCIRKRRDRSKERKRRKCKRGRLR
jgi:hypothetical protein